MASSSHSDARLSASWNAKADEWHQQVGQHGDKNRLYNSDPVLTRMLGDVAGLDLLDAGCGTGYLAIKLAGQGARVTAVDHAERMVAIGAARAAELAVDIRWITSSVSELSMLPSSSFDRVVSNYVLMDVCDAESTVAEFHRVLRPGGVAVIVLSHPCFSPPDGGVGKFLDGSTVYHWRRSYFDSYEYTEEWGHFTTPFVAYHRPLSAYWRMFTKAGFVVCEFDEPAVPVAAPDGLDAAFVRRLRMSPNSVAFRLQRD